MTTNNPASMTVTALRALAKQHGLKGYSKLRKAELVQYVEEVIGTSKVTTAVTFAAPGTNQQGYTSSSILEQAANPQPSVGYNRADLEAKTVSELAAIARSLKLKGLSGLRKADIINYVLGYLADPMGQGKANPILAEKLTSVYMPENVDWLDHLNTTGWAVVPVPNWTPDYVAHFFSWLEACCSKFSRDDYTTWTSKNLPSMLHNCIIKQYLGHTEWQWQLREECAPIFAEIYGCEPKDLLSSFDGGCFATVKQPVPAKESTKTKAVPKIKPSTFKHWLHTDTYRTYTGPDCIQGIVNFVDNGPEDGGLVLIADSHKVWEEYMTRHQWDGITWGICQYNDPILNTLPLIKICAPAGHIILWNGKLFHCAITPTGSALREDNSPRFRMGTYISMQPRSLASPEDLAKRIKWYKEGRMTNHWTSGTWLASTAKEARSYGGEINKPATIDIAELNELRSALIGY